MNDYKEALPERGSIRNKDRYSQLHDFSGLRFGNITPTDIDGVIDFRNQHFVVIELKGIGAPFEYGQRVAIERFINVCDSSNKKSIAILARHDTSPEDLVDTSSCLVEKIYFNSEWKTRKGDETVKSLIDKFLRRVGFDVNNL